MDKKIEHVLPDNLELIHHGSYIEIVRKWFGWQVVVMTAFAVVWNAAIFNSNSQKVESGEPTLAFALIVAVGICLTYCIVAGWLNRTHIFVSHGKIAVRHRPIPWLGNKELDALNLKQLYVKEKISQSRNSNFVTYQIHALTHNRRNIKLVSDLETSEQAFYIEQEIEKYLRIEDIPVRGEIGR